MYMVMLTFKKKAGPSREEFIDHYVRRPRVRARVSGSRSDRRRRLLQDRCRGHHVLRQSVAVRTVRPRASRRHSKPDVDEHRLAFREGYRAPFPELLDEAHHPG
ncbi:hypothetical protein ACVGVM_28840 (plasmid) [Pseudonocardia bannensis]|uniref:ABM domain-containing protein n=1 Tax=Pseudonocardia bannensis TaxID=630973 RepID=A0A848DJ37_9PSEU|nr:hypothetical protein [Pseudonocardia bannensis]NMH92464.1 hypothetical protein [Pseudonocardia bannensis]